MDFHGHYDLRTESAKEPNMKGILALVLLAHLISGCVSFTQSRLDREVDRRCREDGGVKIYETAPLSSEMFNKYGHIEIPSRMEGESLTKDLGPQYIWKNNTRSLHGGWEDSPEGKVLGSPSMWRVHYQILRRTDRKLLGEWVGYSRYGGDPFWARFTGVESSHSCPEKGWEDSLLDGVFYKETRP